MVQGVETNYRTYSVKKGDSLWRIAKKELGQNATNNQIANYSNQIAKLNKIKKPNTIFVNEKLYLPAQQAKPAEAPKKVVKTETKKAPAATSQPAKTTAPKQAANVAKAKSVKSVKPAKPVKQAVATGLSNAEKGFTKFANNVLSNDLYIEKAYLGSVITTKLYHISTQGRYGIQKLVGSYEKDKNGKFKSFTFDGDTKINSYGYDYILTSNGNIYKKYDYDMFGPKESPVVGRVSQENLRKVTTALDKQLPKR